MGCLEIHGTKPLLDWLPLTEADEIPARKKAVIRCRACHQYLTENQFLIPVEGDCTHYFENPSGQGFDIQTYSLAEGCVVGGRPTEHFSWFAGHAWQIAFCRECNTPVGWYFSCEGLTGFFGLITDRLLLE